MALGASEHTAIEHWLAPNPEPAQWERSILKNPEGTEIGIYYRGKFEVGAMSVVPDQIEYIFEHDALISSTLYFSEIEGPAAQRLFNQWLTQTFGANPIKPSAVQKAADRVTTYFSSNDDTWKWVVNGSDITIRHSSNTRLPTALAEAVALGFKPLKGQLHSPTVKQYAKIHRRLINGKTEVDTVRSLLAAKATPPLMKSDLRLVLAMMLSAAFKNAATHPSAPVCQSKLLVEAGALAPQLGPQIEKLNSLCTSKVPIQP